MKEKTNEHRDMGDLGVEPNERRMPMLGWVRDFFDLLFPRCCVVCGRKLASSEQFVCACCLRDLPRTYFYKDTDNPLARNFWGLAELERAAGFIFYRRDNAVRHILYHLKYYHQPRIGVFMGRLMAREVGRHNYFDGIDVLVPVPLSKPRQRHRGYNQCQMLAQGISEVTGLPIDNRSLIRKVANVSQTKMRRMDRWDNVQGIFALTDTTALVGKHVLLIDDVVTTGATLLSCIETLSAVPGLKVSILTLAVTKES